MRYFIFCFALLCLLAPGMAWANGYDAYANPVAWSPDSKQAAYIQADAWPYASGPANGDLVLADTRNHREVLLSGELTSPCFSPDGKYLAVVLDGDLVAYQLEAGHAYWLTVRGDVLDCCFAPVPGRDGAQRVIFSAGERFYGSKIYSMPFSPEAEAQPELVTNTGAGISCFGPAPAPDGRRFLFLHQYSYEVPDSSAVYERLYWLADGEAQVAQQLTLPQQREDDYHESNVCWLDADTIVFQRGGWGDWRLIRKDLVSGDESILFTDAQQPSLSADGAWLAFTRRDYRAKEEAEYAWDVPGSVWVQKVGTRRLRKVSANGLDAAHPAVSPDGTRVAWLQWDGVNLALRQARLGNR